MATLKGPRPQGSREATPEAFIASQLPETPKVHTSVEWDRRWISPRLALLSVLSLLGLLVAARAYLDNLSSVDLGSFSGTSVDAKGHARGGAKGRGAGLCRMAWMSPGYLKLDGFGSEFTRLSGKYTTYLYREQGWNLDEKPRGVPVLFIPGNAGSFRQIRSIASSAARQFYSHPGGPLRPEYARSGAAGLDFFTVDFNEDFSAFHGETLFEEAEYVNDAVRYILSLYTHTSRTNAFRRPLPDPGAVIIIGHSMGGIVARKMLDMSNYLPGSVNTILTISTPHAVPPVTLDRRIETVYSDIDRLWRKAFSTSGLTDSKPPPTALRIRPDDFASDANANPLADVVLISLSGGTSDTTISPSDTSLVPVVPPSHGFTAFTTSVPGVWSPIDHLAILWCDQLRRILAKALLDISDASVATQVKPLDERLGIFKKVLLTGLEEGDRKEALGNRMFVTFQPERTTVYPTGSRLVLANSAAFRDSKGPSAHLLPIPSLATYSPSLAFSLLTDATIGEDIEVIACRGDLPSLRQDDDSTPVRKSCFPLAPAYLSRLPLSSFHPLPIAEPGPDDNPAAPSMAYIEAKVQHLSGYGFLAVTVRGGSRRNLDETSPPSFLIAEFSDVNAAQHTVSASLWRILFSGLRIDAVPATHKSSLVSQIHVPAIATSLLAFQARVFRSGACDTDGSFAPLMRQHSAEIGESKFHPNVHSATLFTHSEAPYIPISTSPFARRGLSLQFWTDPTVCGDGSADVNSDGGGLAIEIRLDIYHSLAKLFLRYRMAIVAFPLAIISWILRCQVVEYTATAKFPPFGGILATSSRKGLWRVVILTIGISLFQAMMLALHLPGPGVQGSLNASLAEEVSRSGETENRIGRSHWAISDLLLGERNSFFFGLAGLLFAVSLGVVAAAFVVIQMLLEGAVWLWFFGQRTGSARVQRFLRLREPTEAMAPQRLASILALLLSVVLFAPYQFAFLVIFMVHAMSTFRALVLAKESQTLPAAASRAAWNRYNYYVTGLMCTFWLLPVNGAILVVWMRNLSSGWFAPFSSDHNVLCVAGFLLWVEAVHTGHMLPIPRNGSTPLITRALPTIAAVYALLYGIRYTFRVYDILNVVFFWLAVLHSGGPSELVRRGPSDLRRRVSASLRDKMDKNGQ